MREYLEELYEVAEENYSENMEDKMILSMETPKNEIKYKENEMQEMYMKNREKYPDAVKSSALEDFLRPFKTFTSKNIYMVGDMSQTSYWFYVHKDTKKVNVAFQDCQRGNFTHEYLHRDLDLHTFFKFPVYTWKVFIDEEQQKQWSKLEYTKYDKKFRIVKQDEVNKVDEYHFTVEELFPELKEQYEQKTKTKTTSCIGGCNLV